MSAADLSRYEKEVGENKNYGPEIPNRPKTLLILANLRR